MISLTFGLFTQVSGSGPLGPLVSFQNNPKKSRSVLSDLDLWDCLGRVKPVLQQNCIGLI